jgi:hypothetical protein
MPWFVTQTVSLRIGDWHQLTRKLTVCVTKTQLGATQNGVLMQFEASSLEFSL